MPEPRVMAIVGKLHDAMGGGKKEESYDDSEVSLPLVLEIEEFLSCIRYGPDGDPKPSKVAGHFKNMVRLALRDIESEGE